MRRLFVIAAALAVAAPLGIWALGSHRASSRTAHPPVPDDRRRAPGIHRASAAELAVRDRVSRDESAKLQLRLRDRAHARAASVPATTWVSLGPTDAPQEFNYYPIASVDSGRPNNILVDPRDPDVVYVAVSGGGLWKTFDFGSASGPHWAPTTDTLPNLAIGALAMDLDHPDTLYVGNGDFIDGSGDTIVKTSDGGGTWQTPVVLNGTYPSGVAAHARAIRSIAVQGDVVLAATDVGLFRSSDAGASFTLVDLPNPGGQLLAESVWSIVPVGGGAWLASGVTACAVGDPAPWVFFGLDPDPTNCPAGNNTAIWRSTDGASWTPISSLPLATTTGRSTLAAGPTADPAHTVVYAFVGSVDGFKTVGFWRSMDAGVTWVDATGLLVNPTLLIANHDDSCIDTDVGHEQTWYNQAIVVDPTNANHVLVGGNLCGMRTLNGTAAAPAWELVSHWLPGPGFGETAHGRLPYVHADWHIATSVVAGGQLVTFAGTDGGVFTSPNVFDAATQAEQVTWTHHNRGLTTHLTYAIASGDPVTANPFVVFSGLQDNGTRFRSSPATPSAFNQPIGGDGIGATVHVASSGTTYWGSVEFQYAYCEPAVSDCSVETPEPMTDAESHWHFTPSPVGLNEDEIDERMARRARLSGQDEDPFFVHYANVETDTVGPSVLTHTDEQVFVSVAKAGGGYTWKSISQDLTSDVNFGGFSNVVASRGTPGLYGAAGMASSEPFYFTTKGNTKTVWTVTKPVRPASDTRELLGPSTLDFPPVLPAGTQPGQVFIGGFTSVMTDGMPPPDDKGRLWRTTDFGQTWESIVGTDPAHRLPNVAVYVVKYDPVTPTTIYAGTDVGVYFTTDDGATWDRLGDNFPMVPVRDIYIAKNQDFIRVATYGRGLWEIYPSAQAGHGAPGNGDYDRNLQIDWIDLAAMSARLGETPATQAAPLYSWILDITGADSDPPIQQLDDADLSALLAKFGGHP